MLRLWIDGTLLVGWLILLRHESAFTLVERRRGHVGISQPLHPI
jgi:hypothetical protein